MKKKNIGQIITEANAVHGDVYSYEKSEYINSKTKMIIICPEHGEFQMSPEKHIGRKQGCPKCAGRGLTTEDVIKNFNKIHNELYDYSLVEYEKAQKNVKIICRTHGVFEQTPNNHLRGQGCPECKGGVRQSGDDFIAKAKNVHGDKYDYSMVNYKNNSTNVEIICKEHGSFFQTPGNHLAGNKCPRCASVTNTKDFLTKATEKYGDKFDYSMVEYANSSSKIKILCKEHGMFEITPTNHLRTKNGCPKCSGNIRKTTEQFIKDATNVHGDKFDYSLVEYKNRSTKIKIVCKKHGVFEQQPNIHLQGKGCPICSKRRSSTHLFIAESTLVHGNKYDYSSVEYVDSKTKIKILCKEHGMFEQSPLEHKKGSGCPMCCRRDTESFVTDSTKIHGNTYSYEHTKYTTCHDKVTITCKKHGDFKQLPHSHLAGSGCFKCANIGISKQETDWLDSLGVKERQKRKTINGRRYIFDGYDPSTNTVYEYMGDFWHGNPDVFDQNGFNKVMKKTFGELYQDTMNKINAIQEAGYNLIYIWESDWLKQ